MSARPLFDIPEGWRLLPSGEELQWRDYAVNKRDTKFDGVTTCAAGAKVRENDSCWYFRRIESPTPAPEGPVEGLNWEREGKHVYVLADNGRGQFVNRFYFGIQPGWDGKRRVTEAEAEAVAAQLQEAANSRAILLSRLSSLEKELAEVRWTCRLGADMLEIAGLDSKDRIEAHRRLFAASIDSREGA